MTSIDFPLCGRSYLNSKKSNNNSDNDPTQVCNNGRVISPNKSKLILDPSYIFKRKYKYFCLSNPKMSFVWLPIANGTLFSK